MRASRPRKCSVCSAPLRPSSLLLLALAPPLLFRLGFPLSLRRLHPERLVVPLTHVGVEVVVDGLLLGELPHQLVDREGPSVEPLEPLGRERAPNHVGNRAAGVRVRNARQRLHLVGVGPVDPRLFEQMHPQLASRRVIG
eukprot:scaffold1496_cov110-Isochrysis_galbana.AAC.11